jgi:hypothetical protein
MAQDPRVRFTTKPCIRDQVPIAYAQNANASGQYQGPPVPDNFLGITNASSAFNKFTNMDALGKIGNVGILNDIGLGNVGKGLRTLNSLSNVVRRGAGNVPSVISEGVTAVFNTLGLSGDQLNALKEFDPNAFNVAVGNAKQIYELVKQGRLSLDNIPAITSQMMRVEQLIGKIFGGNAPNIGYGIPVAGLQEKCNASAYAMDLVSLHPKYKNLFVIQFIVQEGSVFDQLKDQGGILKPVQFIVKRTTRPNITFQTEDANLYNYRTKVVTKTEYQEMDVAFIDDQKNYTTQFFKILLEYFSPASRIPKANGHQWKDTGMKFDADSSASLGILPNNQITIFSEFVLYHVYGWGQYVNKYHFHNPKITNLVFDDVDMYATDTGNEVQLKFVYDAVHIETGLVMDGPDAKVSSLTDIGAYPLQNTNPAAKNSAASSVSSAVSSIPRASQATRDRVGAALTQSINDTYTSTYVGPPDLRNKDGGQGLQPIKHVVDDTSFI